MGIGEEKSDTTVETKVFPDGLISQIEENVNALTIGPNDITPIEENVSTVDKCSLQIPTGSAVEEALFSWPIQQLDPSDNCSSKMPDTTSPSREDVTVAVNSSSLLECSGEADNEGGADKRVDCGSETKCSGVVSSLAEENVCTAGISSVGVAVKSAVVESDFLQSCLMFDAVDNCSGTPDIPDLSGEDLAAVFNSLQCFGQIDNEGIDDSGVDICPEIKCYSYVPSLITENICDLNTNSFELATENICSARRLDMMGLSVAINSSNSAECSKPTDIEGRDDSRVNFGSETKYSPIVPSFSRRSSRVHKPMGKTQTKIITRKCPKTAKVRYPDKNMEISFNSARRKRSSVSKLPRSSVWGVLGNVNKAFTENSELNFSEVQGQELQKANGSRGNAKRNKVRESGNSKRSVKSSCASSSCIRLKVRLGNEVIEKCLNVMIPAVVDTSAPATANEFRTETVFGTMPGFSKLINHVKDKMGNDETEQHNSGDSSVDCEGGTGEYRDDGLEVHLAIKDPDSSILEKSAGVTAGCYLGISSADYGGDVNTDPGTSPDSEIINLLQDAEIGSRCQEDLHDSVLISKGFSDLENVNYKRRNSSRGDGSPGQEGINTVIPLNTSECRQKVGICSVSRETLTLSSPADACILSSSKELSTEPMPLSTRGVVGDCRNVLKIENDSEDKTPCNTDVGLRLPESPDSKIFIPSTKTKGHKLSKCSKSGGGSKGMSKDSDSARNRKGNAYRKRENQRTSGNKIEVTKNASDVAICKVEGPTEAGNNMVNVLGMTNSIDNIDSVNVSYLDVASNGLGEQILLQRKAWVCCDDCHKWRRIPANLADSLEENSRWICKDNMDKAFAGCSIPQEKSNADINAELELSDVSGEEDASDGRKYDKDLDCRPMKAPQPASFTCIPHNEYLHRNCKSQTIDEVMVCHCKPPLDGRMGCGDECLNRMLNIECVRGTCPCGDLCSNQQFQKRQYAGMRWFPTGKKGYGLQLLDNVTKGQFLIEYVGEVLDMNAYEARQKKYALDGHKHFYFMTLNGSEVIDASAKGNIGRFINHSCDPNCRTEKWMINGEICIGLFAVRDMKKGEEVTFDYNYVRVFGAAAKKCHCGALQCQGYIGGDPSNTEVIVQGDSDEEFPEPVMLFEDGKRKARLKNKISRTKRTQTEENLLEPENKVDELATDGNKVDEPTTDAVQLQINTQIDDSSIKVVPVVSELNCSLSGPEENSAQTEDVTSISISSVQEELPREDDPLKPSVTSRSDASTAKLGKLIPDGITANKKSKFETLTQQRISSKLGHRVKTSRSSNSVKKGKVNSGSQNVSKPQVTPDRSELQSIKAPADGRFESVEVKLNELLDGDGGVSKRKDAAKGYLKLLLLTAASGDSGNGEAIQSNRELSMILDALLKTKSRIVLIDIINKNGLRMLHNIMKKYRRDFKKIPILRKLLKVLEYLAVREILTQEHINGGPPCPGMESFKESILSLTEHEDKQVHQISRSFRDRWIPRHLRRLGYVDRADGREFHRGSNYNRFSASPNLWHDPAPRPSQAIDCVKQATPVSAPVAGPGAQEGCFAESTGTTTTTRIRKRKSRWDQPGDINLDSKSLPDKEQETNSGLIQNHSEQDQSPMSDNNAHDDDNDDAPPGFSSPAKPPATPSCGSRATSISLEPLRCPEAVTGRPQEKFVSRMAVAYGIPLSIANQFGSEICGSWITAPGIPFYPFPPLPQKKTGHESSAPAGSRMERSLKRTRGGGDDLGKRYFKQKKWNNQRRNRDNNNNNGWFRNIKCSQGCSSSRVIEKQVQPGNNNCYQHLNHIHHH